MSKSRGKPIDINLLLPTKTRKVICSLKEYKKQDSKFIYTLCCCDNEYCLRLHPIDFDELNQLDDLCECHDDGCLNIHIDELAHILSNTY